MRMRIPGHRIVVLLGITLLMVLGCQTPPGPLLEGEGTSLDSPAAERHPLLEGEACRTLENIDSLMWQQPDSAFALLQAFAASPTADSLGEFDIHYFQLLVSELLYKNDCQQTNRKDLLRAVAYYDSIAGSPGAEARGMSVGPFCRRDASHASAQTTAFLAARAHYINGVGYYERDSVVEACTEYLKALETMEGHFEEKELVGNKTKFMALAYTRLANLFSDHYLHEQAIYFAQNSLLYYKKTDYPSWHLSWILNDIGANYDMMEELDSADYYYRKASFVLGDSNTIMSRDIAAHQAYLDYKKDCRNTTAVISNLLQLSSESESERETITRYSYIGEILFHEKQFDSAWMYLSEVFHGTPDVGLKKQAAERLVEICKAQQRNTNILEYAGFLVPFANQEENKSEIKSQMIETYKIFVQERLELQHRKETMRQVKIAMIVVAVLLVVILTTILLYHKNKRHQRHLETMMESERRAHKMQQAALAGRLKQSNAALKERNDRVNAIEVSTVSHRQTCFVENYKDEPVCQQILALCNDKRNPIKSTVPVTAYANIALDDTQKAQLKDAALYHYDTLFEKLKREHPELKEKDFQFCYLCLLGLDNVQIAVLLQKSISAIWDRERRLKKILGSDDRIVVTLFGMMIN
ncbi:MAG: hypothetical protein K6A94_06000 [Bacteroidales bacterium]|nr:hypothetical protein [Bacteroidales bacterium]